MPAMAEAALTPQPAQAWQPFSLVPFEHGHHPAGLRFSGAVCRQGADLRIRYRLEGPLQRLRLPPPTDTPERRDLLWQDTCLECFLALPGEGSYREVNLSPEGHWNAYRLEGYREGLAVDPEVSQPELRLLPDPPAWEVQLRCLLPPSLAVAPELELAVTGVLATCEGQLSYWALRHGGATADFHWRDDFCLRI